MGHLRTATVALGLVLWLAHARPAAADSDTYCTGDYSKDLAALSPHAREIEAHPASYSYAVRTTASYECVSYGGDGNIKKSRSTATAYGTAFGYRRDGSDTLLLTNEHVAEWPAVTDDAHAVDGVPAGCKRVADSLKIVDDDHDDYSADDIPLTRVVVDPALDIAILRAHSQLEIMPWRIGKSAALVARDAVEVRGFPLGEFQAINVGKVVSAYDHDDQGDWNHDDFVVDALLSSGGSGSPVFAVSCRTGELELVGIFHAHYNNASALNVVVAIDQVRDLMTTLKRSTHPTSDLPLELDIAARAQITDAAAHDADPPFFAVGPLTASVRARADGVLVFSLFTTDFPKTSSPLLVVEDLAADDGKAFGRAGAVYVAVNAQLQLYSTADADADSQAVLTRALGLLRTDAHATFQLRIAARSATSRDAFERVARQKRALGRMLDSQRDAAQAIVDFVGRAGAHSSGPAVGLAQLEAGTPTTATVTTRRN